MTNRMCHDDHYNAPVGSIPRLVRKLSSGGASIYDTPRAGLYSSDAQDPSEIEALSKEHHQRLRDRALQRRKTLLEAQAKAHKDAKRELQKQRVLRKLSSFRCSFDRLNPIKWVENQDQKDKEIIHQLEQEYEDALDQHQYMILCKQASDACLEAVNDHLQHFLEDHPDSTYEQWVQELHPDNTCLFRKRVAIDHRFYLSESDHRHLWNVNLGNGMRAHVPPRHLKEEFKLSSDEL